MWLHILPDPLYLLAYSSYIFEQQSTGRSSKQDQVKPLRAPFCTNGPRVQEYPQNRKQAQVPTQCLDRTGARKGSSRQTFRHSTGNGWALGSMNPIRCSKKQEELLKSSALSQPSVTETGRSLPPTFSSLWSHTEPTTAASSGKQIGLFLF